MNPPAAFGATWTYMGNKKSDTVSMWPNWDHKTYTVEDFAAGSSPASTSTPPRG